MVPSFVELLKFLLKIEKNEKNIFLGKYADEWF